MEAPVARFPVETKSDVCEIDQNETQLVISKFRYLNYLLIYQKLFNTLDLNCSDKFLIVITQLNKLGNLIEVRRDVASKEDPSSSVYSIRYS